jgi:hypothetical protein
MIIVAAFIIAGLTVPLAGGKLSALTALRLRALPVICLAMALQIFVINIVASSINTDVAEGIHLLSYVLAFVFVWLNRRVAGIGILAIGATMNAVAIGVNGGVMPTTDWAIKTSGQEAEVAGTFTNSGRVEEAKLVFLGDVFAWPSPMPLANVFSLGDILLVVGSSVALHNASASKWSRRRQKVASHATTDVPATPAVASIGQATADGEATLRPGNGQFAASDDDALVVANAISSELSHPDFATIDGVMWWRRALFNGQPDYRPIVIQHRRVEPVATVVAAWRDATSGGLLSWRTIGPSRFALTSAADESPIHCELWITVSPHGGADIAAMLTGWDGLGRDSDEIRRDATAVWTELIEAPLDELRPMLGEPVVDAPHTETDAPHTETDAPHTETDAPHTETDAPQTETDAPHTETDDDRTLAVAI